MCESITKKLLLIVILVFIILSIGQVVQAEAIPDIYFTPQVGIPGEEIEVGKDIKVGPTTFANYIVAIYNWSIRAIVLLAIVMVMIAGFRWMMAAGNASIIKRAKDQITSAFIGLILAVGSYALLNFINPSLVRFRGLEIKPLAEFVASSCDKIKDKVTCEQISDPLCLWNDVAKRCYGSSRAEWSKLYGNITGTTTYTDGRWVEKVMLVASYYSEETNDYRWALSEVDNSPDETDNDYSVEVYVPISTDLSRGVYGLLWVVTRDPWAIDDKYCVGLNNDAHRTSASTDCVLSNYPSTAFSLLTDEDGQDLQINLDITAGDYQED